MENDIILCNISTWYDGIELSLKLGPTYLKNLKYTIN